MDYVTIYNDIRAQAIERGETDANAQAADAVELIIELEEKIEERDNANL